MVNKDGIYNKAGSYSPQRIFGKKDKDKNRVSKGEQKMKCKNCLAKIDKCDRCERKITLSFHDVICTTGEEHYCTTSCFRIEHGGTYTDVIEEDE